MTVKEILAELKSLGDDRIFKHYKKRGAGDHQYGVKLGDIRKLAKKSKGDHQLALELWETNNIDARFVAILLLNPKQLSSNEMDAMVRSVKFDRVADWLNAYVVKKHPDNECLRKEWIQSEDPMAARAGWNLTSIKVAKKVEGINIVETLDCLENKMLDASELAQWTMNFTLAEIGINYPEYRERAIAIGEKFGIYRDYPVSKGCTSPFAPIWIEEMVKRQA